jgi:hypothetical protein
MRGAAQAAQALCAFVADVDQCARSLPPAASFSVVRLLQVYRSRAMLDENHIHEMLGELAASAQPGRRGEEALMHLALALIGRLSPDARSLVSVIPAWIVSDLASAQPSKRAAAAVRECARRALEGGTCVLRSATVPGTRQ